MGRIVNEWTLFILFCVHDALPGLSCVVCLDQTNERYSWVVALADHTSALCSYERANDRWYGIINDNSYARINSLINNEGINVTVINVGSIWKFTAGSDVYFATLETFFFNVREHGNSIAEFLFSDTVVWTSVGLAYCAISRQILVLFRSKNATNVRRWRLGCFNCRHYGHWGLGAYQMIEKTYVFRPIRPPKLCRSLRGFLRATIGNSYRPRTRISMHIDTII